MLALFAAICLIWGGTWLAVKVGIQSVPPVFFAGTRFLAAGAILLLISWLRNETRRLEPREVARLMIICLLMVGTHLCAAVLGDALCALRSERRYSAPP